MGSALSSPPIPAISRFLIQLRKLLSPVKQAAQVSQREANKPICLCVFLVHSRIFRYLQVLEVQCNPPSLHPLVCVAVLKVPSENLVLCQKNHNLCLCMLMFSFCFDNGQSVCNPPAIPCYLVDSVKQLLAVVQYFLPVTFPFSNHIMMLQGSINNV